MVQKAAFWKMFGKDRFRFKHWPALLFEGFENLVTKEEKKKQILPHT